MRYGINFRFCCSQSSQAVPARPYAKGRIDKDTAFVSREVKYDVQSIV
jgi:hypothetical protein